MDKQKAVDVLRNLHALLGATGALVVSDWLAFKEAIEVVATDIKEDVKAVSGYELNAVAGS